MDSLVVSERPDERLRRNRLSVRFLRTRKRRIRLGIIKINFDFTSASRDTPAKEDRDGWTRRRGWGICYCRSVGSYVTCIYISPVATSPLTNYRTVVRDTVTQLR